MVKQIGGAQAVRHLARELDRGWDAINAAGRIYGVALLAADSKLKGALCWSGLITNGAVGNPSRSQ